MDQDLLIKLLPEIRNEILSRLPIRAIIQCKFVCKSWLEMVESQEFAKFHISRSAAGIAKLSRPYSTGINNKSFEFAQEFDPQIPHRDKIIPHCEKIFKFPRHSLLSLHSSVNGLLFVHEYPPYDDQIFVCNPTTCDYMKFPPFLEPRRRDRPLQHNVFGFGVSKESHKYKVVRILFPNCSGSYKCEVYTLGTGTWRSIAAAPSSTSTSVEFKWKEEEAAGAFLNGNLHWLAFDSSSWISCFDLETELFSAVSLPPSVHGCRHDDRTLSAVGDWLCLCDKLDDESVDIWFMKKYGDVKSWTKTFIIEEKAYIKYRFGRDPFPFKVFKNGGEIMLAVGNRLEIFLSIESKTVREHPLSRYECIHDECKVVYTPTFLSVKTFAMENVSSY